MVYFEGRDVKGIILIISLCLFSGSVLAKTEESQLIEKMKISACGVDERCQSLFTSALGMASMISRYHGECMGDNDRSKQCRDAENTYKDIEYEYEKDKKLRN